MEHCKFPFECDCSICHREAVAAGAAALGSFDTETDIVLDKQQELAGLGPKQEQVIGAGSIVDYYFNSLGKLVKVDMVGGEPHCPHCYQGIYYCVCKTMEENSEPYDFEFVEGNPTIDPKEAAMPLANPKAAIGSAKIPLGLCSPAGLFHEAMAMDDGATKYGAWNFRDVDIRASVYFHAALRHIMLYMDGEEVAPDSKVHHLGHAKACLGIWLDSIQNGNYVDDRPPSCNLGELFDMFYNREK